EGPISFKLLQPGRVEFWQGSSAFGARALPRRSATDQFVANTLRERYCRAGQSRGREVHGRHQSHRHRSRSRSQTATQNGPVERIEMKTLLAILLFATVSFAQQKTPPGPGAARPLNLPKITEKKLANGLTVVLAPLPNVPKVSAILTLRSATTASDRDAHPGIAQIAASVANEGTDTRTSKQIKEELRSIGGTLGLGSDADSTT